MLWLALYFYSVFHSHLSLVQYSAEHFIETIHLHQLPVGKFLITIDIAEANDWCECIHFQWIDPCEMANTAI